MSNLSDTQALILSAAAQRPDGNVLPLPGSLRGGAATKIVAALLSRGLIREQVVASLCKADPALNTFWRNLEDGRGVLLFVTDAGLEAVGVEQPDSAPTGGEEAAAAAGATDHPAEQERPPVGRTGAGVRKPREGTKQAELVAMLEGEAGATIAEIMEATGWQPHTVRGALAGALRKRLGLTVASEKVERRGRVYRIER